MRQVLAVASAAAALLVAAAPAAARVRLISLTSPTYPGAYATLTARVSPTATCSIRVYYKTTVSHAKGLIPLRRGGRVSWTWKVGTRTTPGRWPIVVSCGRAGTLNTSFVVR
jgi:micrococcal nuclease